MSNAGIRLFFTTASSALQREIVIHLTQYAQIQESGMLTLTTHLWRTVTILDVQRFACITVRWDKPEMWE